MDTVINIIIFPSYVRHLWTHPNFYVNSDNNIGPHSWIILSNNSSIDVSYLPTFDLR